MNLKELQHTDWYNDMSIDVRKVIDKIPPFRLYKLITTGEQCKIDSYEEERITDKKTGDSVVIVTLKLEVVGGIGIKEGRMRFNIKLDEVELWDKSKPIE